MLIDRFPKRFADAVLILLILTYFYSLNIDDGVFQTLTLFTPLASAIAAACQFLSLFFFHFSLSSFQSFVRYADDAHFFVCKRYAGELVFSLLLLLFFFLLFSFFFFFFAVTRLFRLNFFRCIFFLSSFFFFFLYFFFYSLLSFYHLFLFLFILFVCLSLFVLLVRLRAYFARTFSAYPSPRVHVEPSSANVRRRSHAVRVPRRLALAPAERWRNPTRRRPGDPDPAAREAAAQLTGQNEELQYRNRQLEEQLRRSGLAPQAPGAPPPARPAQHPAASYPAQAAAPAAAQPRAPAAAGSRAAYDQQPGADRAGAAAARRRRRGRRRGDAFDPSQNPNAPGRAARARRRSIADAGRARRRSAGRAPGRAARSVPAPASPRSPAVTGAAAVPPASAPRCHRAAVGRRPKDEFDLGIGYMQRKDYALAEETMRNFAQKYPERSADRRIRNTGSARASSSASNIATPRKPSSASPPNSTNRRRRRTRCCGSASRWRR